MDTINGRTIKKFMGYPIHIVPGALMPNDTGTQAGNVTCLFGDFRRSCMFGERRGISIALSDQFRFQNDLIALRAVERVDIQNHELGDDSDVGGIVALIAGAAA